MNYNMKLRLKDMIENDLANAIRNKKKHSTNACALDMQRKSIERSRVMKHHEEMAQAYEEFEQTLNHYLITIERLDDDIKWTLFHLRNLKDLPNDMVKTSLENIENVLITGNYVKEGD